MADPDVLKYYSRFNEDARLNGAVGQLEFVRSLELLERHLLPPPARVLDIGGGTGPYSEALAQRGYEMHLVDPVPAHVEAARKRGGIASAVQGDARHLEFHDNSADALLLMGPLYHLTEEADRHAALREAWRVLKPGGMLAAAAISRLASWMDGLAQQYIEDPQFQEIVRRDLASGDHRNETDKIEYFISTRFHFPHELIGETQRAGFAGAEVFAVEGLVTGAVAFERWWANPPQREFILEILRCTESLPSALGASSHLMVFARKPASG